MLPTNAHGIENAADTCGGVRSRSWARHDRRWFDADDFCVHFSGVFPFAPGNLGEDGVSRSINVSGFKSRAGSGDVLGHGFLGPGRIRGAYKNRQGEANARAGAAFAGYLALRGGCGNLELESEPVADAFGVGDANHARWGFGLGVRAGVAIEGECDPNAGSDIAAFQALDEHAGAGDVDGVRGLHAHAERAAPAEAGGKAELGARVLAQFGWDRHAIHAGHRSGRVRGRQTKRTVGETEVMEGVVTIGAGCRARGWTAAKTHCVGRSAVIAWREWGAFREGRWTRMSSVALHAASR
jgi:hypothetical protein